MGYKSFRWKRDSDRESDAMKAVVMAGGQGTRLRPLTSNLPKPMVPIVNRPVIEHIIRLLHDHGINDVVITLQFLPHVIRNYFGDGSDHDISINYVVEEIPLGTAGSVKNAQHLLDDTFIVISGDALTDIDLTEVVNYHKKNRTLATITLKQVENPLEFGIVILGEGGKIDRFLEKPSWGEVFSDTINTGIYVLEPEIFDFIPKGREVDFSKDIFPKLLDLNKSLYGYVANGYWKDIGNLEQYFAANQDVLDGNVAIEPDGIKMASDIWIGRDVEISPGAKLSGPTVLDDYVKIEAGASVGEYSILGESVVIKAGASTVRTIIGKNSYIGPNSTVRSLAIGRNCDIKSNVQLSVGSVVGDDCLIGDSSFVNYNVRIYPFKTVESGAAVNNDIIWESKGIRTIFGKEGVSGLINVDITPDYSLRLAMAYGSTLNKNAIVTVSRDANPASRMIKRVMSSGLNSTAVHCRDLRIASASLNRFDVINSGAAGGIHVRVYPFDPQRVQINFMNSTGVNLDPNSCRKIETLFHRGEFRRAFFNEIGETVFPPMAKDYYSQTLLSRLDREVISKAGFKIVVDYSYGTAALVAPQIMGKLGSEVIAVHGYTDEEKTAITTEEFEKALENLRNTVSVFKADLGVLIDSAGEKIFIVNELGKVIPGETALVLLLELMSADRRGGLMAVPFNISSAAEEIASRNGCEILRTRLTSGSLMDAASEKGVFFAGMLGGGFIFPDFIPSFDALMSLGKLLELMAKNGKPLSQLQKRVPSAHVVHHHVGCAWDKKGLVMRQLIENFQGEQIDLIDGIKINLDGAWALILPDPEEPLFHVYAEGKSLRKSHNLASKYSKMVKELQSAVEE